MVRVGIIGLGFMGVTHYQAYARMKDVQVTAIADRKAQKARGDLTGVWSNFEGEMLQQLPMEHIRGTTHIYEPLGWDDVDVIDVCLATPMHRAYVTEALRSGKHVLCEKPLAANIADAEAIVAAAEQATDAGKLFMPAMCMRFWPQWAWLKQAVEDGRYGAVRAAQFHRVAPPPPAHSWFRDGKLSGGGLIDMHIHDTDFVHYLFGMPAAVTSRGYSVVSGEVDHVSTLYHYDDVPLVSAEGGWSEPVSGSFSMRFTVHFERAMATYDVARSPALEVTTDGKTSAVEVPAGDGYDAELRYFIDCVKEGRKPQVVTGASALASMRIADAERRSVESGQTQAL